jgi:hypothetical protein
MRRNCPHCGADQVVADDKLAAGLIILKCHHCSASSAVQGSAINQLNQIMDKPLRVAPSSVLRPIAPVENQPSEPEIEPKISSFTLPPVPAFLKPERPEARKIPEPVRQAVASQEVRETVESVPVAPTYSDEPSLSEPEQLASTPVPVLIEIEEEAEDAPIEAEAYFNRFREGFETVKPYAVPLVLAFVCFVSGGYLIRSAQVIRSGDGWWATKNTAPAVPSDLVSGKKESAETASAQAVSAQTAATAAPAQPVIPSAESAASRTLASSAQPPQPAAKAPVEKRVEVSASSAILRSGPGTQYRKVGMARAELKLLVRGAYEDWIEVETPEDFKKGLKAAWIRKDLVKPIQSVAQQDAKPSGH